MNTGLILTYIEIVLFAVGLVIYRKYKKNKQENQNQNIQS